MEFLQCHGTSGIFWCSVLGGRALGNTARPCVSLDLGPKIRSHAGSPSGFALASRVNAAFSDDLPHLGLKVLAQKFPEGLITGSLPASCQQALPPGSARKRSSPKMPPSPAENKWRFTPEDLKKIEYYLEEDQGPADNPSKIF